MVDTPHDTSRDRREALDAAHAARWRAMRRRRIEARKAREDAAAKAHLERTEVVSERVRSAMASAKGSLDAGLELARRHQQRADAMIEKIVARVEQ